MTQPKAKLLPHNPNAVYLTSRGWVYPDGTFKPHVVRTAPMVQERPSVWARLKGFGK